MQLNLHMSISPRILTILLPLVAVVALGALT
jgi:hypothetical protein